MRLLFLTNFYPPASRGGYEQWCQEVAEGLRRRGHDVAVLTSRHGRSTLDLSSDPDWVMRDLYLEMELASLRNGVQFFTHRTGRENANGERLREVIASFTPDLALIWGMWNLPRSLPALAETLLPNRVAYYLGDYWPTLPSQFSYYWQEPARRGMNVLPKRVLGAVARQMLARESLPGLQFSYVMFPTAYMREELERQGWVPRTSAIVYGAVDTSPYLSCRQLPENPICDKLSLLYVGRLTAEKGVLTAIESLGQLVNQRSYKGLRLVIVGTGDDDYTDYLHRVADKERVTPFVQFLGMQPREAMPELYAQADVLLFTSVWSEPFGRVLVEAMASGLVVVGTATGGAAEILADDENALTFPPGDAAGLARQIVRLIESPALRQRLAQNGRRQAVEKFDIGRMTAEIEAFLQRIVDEE